MRKNYELDMTEGPIVKQLIRFALPILAVNILQILFTTADTVVLGRFVPEERSTVAVAAVGATTSLINLLIGFFVGISLGANVLVARCKGGNNPERAKKYVGCSVLLSLISGLAILLIGFFGAETFLSWMNCKNELLALATKYLKIYFLGMPLIMLYNFAASILRAVGDTVRPLIFLLAGGVLNVGLNIFFVTAVGLDVEGVAIATVASNAVSAICCLVVMLKSKGFCRLDLKYLRIFGKELKDLLYLGIPSGLQKVFFSITNVLIQANVNAFGPFATAGNSVSSEIDKYIYEVGESLAISTLSFTGQNMEAKKYDRVKETIKKTIMLIVCTSLPLGILASVFSEPLCLAIRNDLAILPYAQSRLYVMATTYFICSIMGVFGYVLRGMGKSLTSMIISLVGSCLLRIVVVYVLGWFFPGNFLVLFLSYPISWLIGVCIQITVLSKLFSSLQKSKTAEISENKENEKVA